VAGNSIMCNVIDVAGTTVASTNAVVTLQRIAEQQELEIGANFKISAYSYKYYIKVGL